MENERRTPPTHCRRNLREVRRTHARRSGRHPKTGGTLEGHPTLQQAGGHSMSQPRNDVNASVPKFCLTLEEHRRTAEGRVRTPQEFVEHFFPNDEKGVTDRVFR